MTENTGYAAFAMWTSIKLHFTSASYDYFKYKGKTNVSKQAFSTNKGKYYFYKLSRRYSLEELKNFYVANLLNDTNVWIGELVNETGEEAYKKWLKRNQSLTYNFENDTMYLFDKYKPAEMLKTNGDYPLLLKELMEENINLETVIYMANILGFLPVWEKEITDDILWPNWLMKIKKYSPFASDPSLIQKCEDILKERIKEYAKTKN